MVTYAEFNALSGTMACKLVGGGRVALPEDNATVVNHVDGAVQDSMPTLPT